MHGRLCLISCCFIYIITLVSCQIKPVIRLGLLTATNDETLLVATSMAINEFNTDLSSYISVDLIHAAVSETNVSRALISMESVGVSAIFTPIGSELHRNIIPLASHYEIPLVSATSSAPSLESGPTDYYIRALIPSDTSQASAMVKLFTSMGWNRVGVVYSNSLYGDDFMSELASATSRIGNKVRVVQRLHIPRDISTLSLQELTDNLVSFASTGDVSVIVLALDMVHQPIVVQALGRAGLLCAGLAVITTDSFAENLRNWSGKRPSLKKFIEEATVLVDVFDEGIQQNVTRRLIRFDHAPFARADASSVLSDFVSKAVSQGLLSTTNSIDPSSTLGAGEMDQWGNSGLFSYPINSCALPDLSFPLVEYTEAAYGEQMLTETYGFANRTELEQVLQSIINPQILNYQLGSANNNSFNMLALSSTDAILAKAPGFSSANDFLMEFTNIGSNSDSASFFSPFIEFVHSGFMSLTPLIDKVSTLPELVEAPPEIAYLPTTGFSRVQFAAVSRTLNALNDRWNSLAVLGCANVSDVREGDTFYGNVSLGCQLQDLPDSKTLKKEASFASSVLYDVAVWMGLASSTSSTTSTTTSASRTRYVFVNGRYVLATVSSFSSSQQAVVDYQVSTSVLGYLNHFVSFTTYPSSNPQMPSIIAGSTLQGLLNEIFDSFELSASTSSTTGAASSIVRELNSTSTTNATTTTTTIMTASMDGVRTLLDYAVHSVMGVSHLRHTKMMWPVNSLSYVKVGTISGSTADLLQVVAKGENAAIQQYSVSDWPGRVTDIPQSCLICNVPCVACNRYVTPMNQLVYSIWDGIFYQFEMDAIANPSITCERSSRLLRGCMQVSPPVDTFYSNRTVKSCHVYFGDPRPACMFTCRARSLLAKFCPDLLIQSSSASVSSSSLPASSIVDLSVKETQFLTYNPAEVRLCALWPGIIDCTSSSSEETKNLFALDFSFVRLRLPIKFFADALKEFGGGISALDLSYNSLLHTMNVTFNSNSTITYSSSSSTLTSNLESVENETASILYSPSFKYNSTSTQTESTSSDSLDPSPSSHESDLSYFLRSAPSTLRTLLLAGNPLSSAFPPIPSNLSQLRKLDLMGCSLEGTIHPTLYRLHELTFLSLSRNPSLSGFLIDITTALSNLETLDTQHTLVGGPLVDLSLSASLTDMISSFLNNLQTFDVLAESWMRTAGLWSEVEFELMSSNATVAGSARTLVSYEAFKLILEGLIYGVRDGTINESDLVEAVENYTAELVSGKALDVVSSSIFAPVDITVNSASLNDYDLEIEESDESWFKLGNAVNYDLYFRSRDLKSSKTSKDPFLIPSLYVVPFTSNDSKSIPTTTTDSFQNVRMGINVSKTESKDEISTIFSPTLHFPKETNSEQKLLKEIWSLKDLQQTKLYFQILLSAKFGSAVLNMRRQHPQLVSNFFERLLKPRTNNRRLLLENSTNFDDGSDYVHSILAQPIPTIPANVSFPVNSNSVISSLSILLSNANSSTTTSISTPSSSTSPLSSLLISNSEISSSLPPDLTVRFSALVSLDLTSTPSLSVPLPPAIFSFLYDSASQNSLYDRRLLACPPGFKAPSAISAVQVHSRSMYDACTFCEPCPLGQWGDGTDCTTCSDGQVAPVSVSLELDYVSDLLANFISPLESYVPSKSSRGFGFEVCEVIRERFSRLPVDGCIPCRRGWFKHDVLARCLPCPPGSYSSEDGSISCTACPDGTFTDLVASPSCFTCPSGADCSSKIAAISRKDHFGLSREGEVWVFSDLTSSTLDDVVEEEDKYIAASKAFGGNWRLSDVMEVELSSEPDVLLVNSSQYSGYTKVTTTLKKETLSAAVEEPSIFFNAPEPKVLSSLQLDSSSNYSIASSKTLQDVDRNVVEEVRNRVTNKRWPSFRASLSIPIIPLDNYDGKPSTSVNSRDLSDAMDIDEEVHHIQNQLSSRNKKNPEIEKNIKTAVILASKRNNSRMLVNDNQSAPSGNNPSFNDSDTETLGEIRNQSSLNFNEQHRNLNSEVETVSTSSTLTPPLSANHVKYYLSLLLSDPGSVYSMTSSPFTPSAPYYHPATQANLSNKSASVLVSLYPGSLPNHFKQFLLYYKKEIYKDSAMTNSEPLCGVTGLLDHFGPPDACFGSKTEFELLRYLYYTPATSQTTLLSANVTSTASMILPISSSSTPVVILPEPASSSSSTNPPLSSALAGVESFWSINTGNSFDSDASAAVISRFPDALAYVTANCEPSSSPTSITTAIGASSSSSNTISYESSDSDILCYPILFISCIDAGSESCLGANRCKDGTAPSLLVRKSKFDVRTNSEIAMYQGAGLEYTSNRFCYGCDIGHTKTYLTWLTSRFGSCRKCYSILIEITFMLLRIICLVSFVTFVISFLTKRAARSSQRAAKFFIAEAVFKIFTSWLDIFLTSMTLYGAVGVSSFSVFKVAFNNLDILVAEVKAAGSLISTNISSGGFPQNALSSILSLPIDCIRHSMLSWRNDEMVSVSPASIILSTGSLTGVQSSPNRGSDHFSYSSDGLPIMTITGAGLTAAQDYITMSDSDGELVVAVVLPPLILFSILTASFVESWFEWRAERRKLQVAEVKNVAAANQIMLMQQPHHMVQQVQDMQQDVNPLDFASESNCSPLIPPPFHLNSEASRAASATKLNSTHIASTFSPSFELASPPVRPPTPPLTVLSPILLSSSSLGGMHMNHAEGEIKTSQPTTEQRLSSSNLSVAILSPQPINASQKNSTNNFGRPSSHQSVIQQPVNKLMLNPPSSVLLSPQTIAAASRSMHVHVASPSTFSLPCDDSVFHHEMTNRSTAPVSASLSICELPYSPISHAPLHHRFQTIFKRAAERSIAPIVIALYLVLPWLTKIYLLHLQCLRLSGPIPSVVAVDPRQDCDGSYYSSFRPYLSIAGLLLWTIGSLIAAVLAIRHARPRLHWSSTRRHLGFLYSSFKLEYNHWEVWIIIRKILILGSIPLAGGLESPSIAVVYLLVVSLFSIWLHLRHRPYNQVGFGIGNRLESLALALFLLNIVGALLLLGLRQQATELTGLSDAEVRKYVALEKDWSKYGVAVMILVYIANFMFVVISIAWLVRPFVMKSYISHLVVTAFENAEISVYDCNRSEPATIAENQFGNHIFKSPTIIDVLWNFDNCPLLNSNSQSSIEITARQNKLNVNSLDDENNSTNMHRNIETSLNRKKQRDDEDTQPLNSYSFISPNDIFKYIKKSKKPLKNAQNSNKPSHRTRSFSFFSFFSSLCRKKSKSRLQPLTEYMRRLNSFSSSSSTPANYAKSTNSIIMPSSTHSSTSPDSVESLPNDKAWVLKQSLSTVVEGAMLLSCSESNPLIQEWLSNIQAQPLKSISMTANSIFARSLSQMLRTFAITEANLHIRGIVGFIFHSVADFLLLDSMRIRLHCERCGSFKVLTGREGGRSSSQLQLKHLSDLIGELFENHARLAVYQQYQDREEAGKSDKNDEKSNSKDLSSTFIRLNTQKKSISKTGLLISEPIQPVAAVVVNRTPLSTSALRQRNISKTSPMRELETGEAFKNSKSNIKLRSNRLSSLTSIKNSPPSTSHPKSTTKKLPTSNYVTDVHSSYDKVFDDKGHLNYEFVAFMIRKIFIRRSLSSSIKSMRDALAAWEEVHGWRWQVLPQDETERGGDGVSIRRLYRVSNADAFLLQPFKKALEKYSDPSLHSPLKANSAFALMSPIHMQASIRSVSVDPASLPSNGLNGAGSGGSGMFMMHDGVSSTRNPLILSNKRAVSLLSPSKTQSMTTVQSPPPGKRYFPRAEASLIYNEARSFAHRKDQLLSRISKLTSATNANFSNSPPAIQEESTNKQFILPLSAPASNLLRSNNPSLKIKSPTKTSLELPVIEIEQPIKEDNISVLNCHMLEDFASPITPNDGLNHSRPVNFNLSPPLVLMQQGSNHHYTSVLFSPHSSPQRHEQQLHVSPSPELICSSSYSTDNPLLSDKNTHEQSDDCCIYAQYKTDPLVSTGNVISSHSSLKFPDIQPKVPRNTQTQDAAAAISTCSNHFSPVINHRIHCVSPLHIRLTSHIDRLSSNIGFALPSSNQSSPPPSLQPSPSRSQMAYTAECSLHTGNSLLCSLSEPQRRLLHAVSKIVWALRFKNALYSLRGGLNPRQVISTDVHDKALGDTCDHKSSNRLPFAVLHRNCTLSVEALSSALHPFEVKRHMELYQALSIEGKVFKGVSHSEACPQSLCSYPNVVDKHC